MSSQGARLFGLGYRGYDGPRLSPRWAIVALGVFTIRRVLGLGLGALQMSFPRSCSSSPSLPHSFRLPSPPS